MIALRRNMVTTQDLCLTKIIIQQKQNIMITQTN